MQKCKWFNNAQTATVLMIDDLSNGYIDINFSGLNPWNDWGYGCRAPKSIFKYYEDTLLKRYPEIKYTVFLPFGKHSTFLVDTVYPSFGSDIFQSDEFKQLLLYIVSENNEIAYHGYHHGSPHPTLDPSTWSKEYEFIGYDEYEKNFSCDIRRIKDELDIDINGGKFPAWNYDKKVEDIITGSPLKWWSFDFIKFKEKHDYRKGILDFPANFSGSLFRRIRNPLLNMLKILQNEFILQRFIDNQHLISIQEHFSPTRVDGKRQPPNIFDDISSLEKFYDNLRGVDIWYATCSEIAHYLDSYDFTEVQKLTDGSYRINYKGNWEKMFLSICSKSKTLKNIATDSYIEGVFKNGEWIFNNVEPGDYIEM